MHDRTPSRLPRSRRPPFVKSIGLAHQVPKVHGVTASSEFALLEPETRKRIFAHEIVEPVPRFGLGPVDQAIAPQLAQPVVSRVGLNLPNNGGPVVSKPPTISDSSRHRVCRGAGSMASLNSSVAATSDSPDRSESLAVAIVPRSRPPQDRRAPRECTRKPQGEWQMAAQCGDLTGESVHSRRNRRKESCGIVGCQNIEIVCLQTRQREPAARGDEQCTLGGHQRPRREALATLSMSSNARFPRSVVWYRPISRESSNGNFGFLGTSGSHAPAHH